MIEEKEKSISDFVELLHDVLYTEKSKNKKVFGKLKNLILIEKKLNFTKDEFINYCFFDDELFPCKQKVDFDEIDDFVYSFFEDSYDAVTFISSDNNTINLLNDRITDFHEMLDNISGVDNCVSKLK